MTTTTGPHRPAFVAHNTRQRCLAHNCTKSRSWTSRYCSAHKKRNTYYGSPNDKAIPPKELAACKEEMRLFMSTFSDHPGIKKAVEWLDRLLERAMISTNRGPCAVELDRLAQQGLTGKEALEALGGAYLWNYRRGGYAVINVGLQMVDALLRSRPYTHIDRVTASGQTKRRYKRPGGKARSAVYSIAVRPLFRLLLGIEKFLNEEEAERRRRYEAYTTPFDTPSDSPTAKGEEPTTDSNDNDSPEQREEEHQP